MNLVRAAMTETCNVFADMPDSVDHLSMLANRLEDIRQANVDHHVELITKASSLGARIIGLGELFTAPYFALHRDAFWQGMAEDADDGPTVRTLREVARARQIVIVAPIYELAGGERFNTAVVIDADGQLLGKYRKCHIPSGANEAGAFDERFYYGASDGRPNADADGARVASTNPYLPVFVTAVGKVGVAICYDRHFEGVMSGLAAGGAQIVFSPAVTFGGQSRRMWELEFAVDAARHGLIIAGSNRRGSEPPWNQEFYGRSFFIGPGGPCANLSTHPDLVLADLDLGQLQRADGSGWHLRGDARPEIRNRPHPS